MTDARLALAKRVEDEPVSTPLWREAFDAVNPKPAPRMVGAQFTEAWVAWNGPSVRFSWLLEVEAWRDAAAMLMPEGWHSTTESDDDSACHWLACGEDGVYGEAKGPHAEARARLAAALRARAIAGRA